MERWIAGGRWRDDCAWDAVAMLLSALYGSAGVTRSPSELLDRPLRGAPPGCGGSE